MEKKKTYLEHVTLNNLKRDFERWTSQMELAEEHIVSFLKVRDIRGILTEDNKDISKDTIYGYFYDEDSNIQEQQVKAIMLDETGEHITFIMDNDTIVYNIESVLSSFADKSDSYSHWFSIGDGYCQGWFTLLSIVECLSEYDEEERYIK